MISTSGDSPNCLAAATTARRHGLRCHGLLGRGGGRLASAVDAAVVVPADDTPRIQELHILLLHVLCEVLEAARGGGGGRG